MSESNTHQQDDEHAVEVKNAEFAWNKDETSTLNDINISIQKRKLIAVVGKVGAGKSSLLSALLGDMEKVRGKVNISGSLAYVPQQAWIQNATVKQNILFINKMNEIRL